MYRLTYGWTLRPALLGQLRGVDLKTKMMGLERERTVMNYPPGTLISFITPLLFYACTDSSRPKCLVIPSNC